MDTAAPRLALVTPSYNQGAFLEQALQSVADQDVPGVEHVVIDGGSSDESVAILERWSSRLRHWSSQPDDGMYDALNQGFARTTGEIMGWLNADDVYLPDALATVVALFDQFPEVAWLTSVQPGTCNAEGQRRWTRRLPGFHRAAFHRGEYVMGVAPFWSGWIPQEATFWRRSLWEAAGGQLDARLQLAGDFDLWARFYRHAPLVGVDQPLALFRRQPAQKTARHRDDYIAEARAVLQAQGASPSGTARALVRKVVTRLPAPLRHLARGVGLAYPGTVLRPSPVGWRAVTTSV